MLRARKFAASVLKKVCKSSVWKRNSPAEWILFSVGMLTIVYIFITIFTNFNRHQPQPAVDSPVSLKDPEHFLATISATVNSSVESGSPITILTNGQEFFPDLLTEIANAKSSIYITDYIWDTGTFGNSLLKALTKKALQGVEVRVLLDGTAGSPSKDLTEELKKAGGKVEIFRPLTWSNFSRANSRTHIRDFVIDGKEAYVGGIAVSDLWLGDATSSDHWHDYMFKSGGSFAKRGMAVFANLWSQTTGENLTAPAATSSIAANDRQFVALFSHPSPDLSNNLENFIWLSIEAASTSIYLESPYLLPPKSIQDALEEKARAGVDVSLIVPSDKTDSKYIRLASQTFYTSLLNAGVKIYEYQPSRFHAKVILIDNIWSIIGSANLDNRSSTINLEYVLGVYDAQFGSDLKAKIAIDKEHAREITLEAWHHTSYVGTVLQQFSRLFIEQY